LDTPGYQLCINDYWLRKRTQNGNEKFCLKVVPQENRDQSYPSFIHYYGYTDMKVIEAELHKLGVSFEECM